MKDCCKNGGKRKSGKPTFKRWFNYLIYAIILAIVLIALVNQINNN